MILFKVEIPNSICGCILGCKVLHTIFGVTVTLTSGLSPRIIVSQAHSANFVFGCIFVLLIVVFFFRVNVPLTSDFGLLIACVESISYTRNLTLEMNIEVVECCILF